MDNPYLSLVIPVYNEEKRLGPTLERVVAYFATKPYSREIILVDDGSTDKSLEVARQILDNHEEYRIISYGANRGKGYALKQGMTASRGQVVLFSDADLATPIEELDNILHWLQPNPERPNGYEVVHGSRKMPGALVEQHQPWLRENMGKVFTWLCNQILGAKVSDATCGFKSYQGEVARSIYARQQLFDWSFDAEIIHIARRRGYYIKEVPVRWHDVRGTKVNLLRDTFRSLIGLFRIRWNGWRGYYDQPVQTETPLTIAGK